MEFLGSPRVKLGHMAALVSGVDAASDGHITFLYTLLNGACPKSYGLQVNLCDLLFLAGVCVSLLLAGGRFTVTG